MIGKWILFVIASVLSVQLFAETEAQRQQSIMSFEYLRAIGGACSVPNFDGGFLKYTYDSNCLAEHKAELRKACASGAVSHFEDLCGAMKIIKEG